MISTALRRRLAQAASLLVLAITPLRAGGEVVQVYVSGPQDAQVMRPAKELRAFRKVRLDALASVSLALPLTRRDLASWDVKGRDWAVEPGTYTVQVGSSSRDIRLTGTLAVR